MKVLLVLCATLSACAGVDHDLLVGAQLSAERASQRACQARGEAIIATTEGLPCATRVAQLADMVENDQDCQVFYKGHHVELSGVCDVGD